MKPTGKLAEVIRKAASKLPGAQEATACAGTSLEATTWGVGKDVFIFAGISKGVVNLRFKLGKSAAAAKKLGVTVGANGWATVKFAEGASPPKPLASWVAESHAIITER